MSIDWKGVAKVTQPEMPRKLVTATCVDCDWITAACATSTGIIAIAAKNHQDSLVFVNSAGEKVGLLLMLLILFFGCLTAVAKQTKCRRFKTEKRGAKFIP